MSTPVQGKFLDRTRARELTQGAYASAIHITGSSANWSADNWFTGSRSLTKAFQVKDTNILGFSGNQGSLVWLTNGGSSLSGSIFTVKDIYPISVQRVSGSIAYTVYY